LSQDQWWKGIPVEITATSLAPSVPEASSLIGLAGGLGGILPFALKKRRRR